jgi:hypothetical protein
MLARVGSLTHMSRVMINFAKNHPRWGTPVIPQWKPASAQTRSRHARRTFEQSFPLKWRENNQSV